MSKFGTQQFNYFNQFDCFVEKPQCVVSVSSKQKQEEQEKQEEKEIIECLVQRVPTPLITYESIYQPEKDVTYEQHVSRDNNIILTITETVEVEPEVIEEKVIEEKVIEPLKREPSLKLLVQKLILDKKIEKDGWRRSI